MRLVIAGAGNLGRELRGWLEPALPPVFIADGFAQVPIESSIADYQPQEGDAFVVAIADCAARAAITEQLLARGAKPVTWAHYSHVSGGARIGAGSLLMPMSLTSTDVICGRGTILNCFASCAHDVVVGDFCTLSGHVDLCGGVHVGNRVFFGSGARVLPGVTVGDDAKIGAGAVVVRNVPARATVFGPPAKEF